MYLKDTWVPTLRSSIKTCLDAVSKGWYNMAESNYEVYQKSKLKKLMELIKFIMQVWLVCTRESVEYQCCIPCTFCIYAKLAMRVATILQGYCDHIAQANCAPVQLFGTCLYT